MKLSLILVIIHMLIILIIIILEFQIKNTAKFSSINLFAENARKSIKVSSTFISINKDNFKTCTYFVI